MIEIEKINYSNIDAVRLISLAEEQVKFASTADEFLSSANELVHLHVIKYCGSVVGFFKLDLDYSSDYEFCPSNGLGLRTFAIDFNQQGKGIGTAAVKSLFLYLKAHYFRFKWVYLTVNCKNPGAKMCYEKGGFENTGKQYLGGPAGPQIIMKGKVV